LRRGQSEVCSIFC